MTAAEKLSELPAGTRRQGYEIRAVLGGGQRSLVYKAYDVMLDRYVALKEYLPVAFAARDENRQLVVLPGKDEAFSEGLKRFIAEAQVMTQLNHFALRGSYQVFMDAGSAYIVMPYYPGKSLRAMVQDDWRAANIGDVLMIVLPLLEGLSLLHRMRYCHCGVSPDNILIRDNGEPILLDFGAAQRPGAFPDRPVTDLAPGFAALEQYRDNGHDVCIGAWTDIYGISAVIYYIVTGILPPEAMARVAHDPLKPLASFARDDLPAFLLEIIDQGLSVAPQNRFASIDDFATALDYTVQKALVSSPTSATPAMSEILSVATAVSAYSPRTRKILQSTWALREQIRQRGVV
ncbi:MAG: serine/threonine protein kinase [Azoarcus sp.]|jgi:serine/threonine protein kinase|nr:serine/threonine protein kinase [Azoarcus sp.]